MDRSKPPAAVTWNSGKGRAVLMSFRLRAASVVPVLSVYKPAGLLRPINIHVPQPSMQNCVPHHHACIACSTCPEATSTGSILARATPIQPNHRTSKNGPEQHTCICKLSVTAQQSPHQPSTTAMHACTCLTAVDNLKCSAPSNSLQAQALDPKGAT